MITHKVNMGPHPPQTQGLVPVSAPNGEIMRVHPDLVEGGQWIIVVPKKKKRMVKGIG